MIKIVNGSKTYQIKGHNQRVLNRINIEIKPKEMVAIMGKSGSGKSTLLHIIAGYDHLTDGQYYYKNKSIDNYNLNHLLQNDIGFIFQDYQLFDYLNVKDNILMGLHYSKKKNDEKHFSQIVRQLDLTKCLDKSIQVLSGGEKQRVAIARILLANKPLILADEPTGALDQDNSQIIMSILKELNHQGKTIIIVTHDDSIAKQCQRVILLENGYAY